MQLLTVSWFLYFQVVIGPEFVVPSYSKVSLFQQPIEEDSDEELEYADSAGGIVYFHETVNSPVWFFTFLVINPIIIA